MRSRINEERILAHPVTGEKKAFSIIRDEIYDPELTQPAYVGGWGEYVFGAWLEQDCDESEVFYISFPYWRNGRFAGQYSLRAEISVIRKLIGEIQRRGWLDRDWAESTQLRQGAELPIEQELHE